MGRFMTGLLNKLIFLNHKKTGYFKIKFIDFVIVIKELYKPYN